MLAPGTQLRQEEVASRLAVSATPVREAFGILETEGFLRRRPHRGVVVAEADHIDMRDRYEIRGVLEALAVERLIARRDPAAVEGLEQILEEARAALTIPDVHRFRLTSLEFHSAIARWSGSDIFAEVHSLLARRTLFRPPLDRARMKRSHREHTGIVAAIHQRDAATASALIRKHMKWNSALVQRARMTRAKAEHGGVA